VNGLPRPSNQNRMIPSFFRLSYSKSSTLRIVLQCHSFTEHTIFVPTPIGTPYLPCAVSCAQLLGPWAFWCRVQTWVTPGPYGQ